MSGEAPAHLKSVLSRLGEKRPPDAEEFGLPSLDKTYRPYARASQKPLFAIHFITPHGSVRSFQYMHLDSDSSYAPDRLTLRFAGLKIVNVVISGRNLWELYDYIHQHRSAWVRQAARDFAADGDAIVTGIAISESVALEPAN
ncbi:MAG TPA: hypothetical protein VGN12_07680 [Pirellulales bacterium]|jgi:hypothetical protein